MSRESETWEKFMKAIGVFDGIGELNEPEVETVTTFKEVQSFLGGIMNINAGGCGIAAYAMYLWLKQRNELPEDFSIIYLHSIFDEEVLNSNKQFLEGKGTDIHSCVHAIIKMNGEYLDSKGDYEISHRLTLEIKAEHIDRFMVSSLNKPEWNNTFNRHQHIPRIEKALGVDLSEVKRVLSY